MCKVLRCPNPSAHVINLTKDAPEVPRYEIPVCDEHYRRIEGGEAYHLDADQWVLLMGTDIKAADLRLITSVVDLTDDMGTAVRHAHEWCTVNDLQRRAVL